MTTEGPTPQAPPAFEPWRYVARKNVLAGLMFVGIAAFGLWVSRNYPIGTALRMGTGYVPRLLCWILLGLGVIVLLQGVLGVTRLREVRPPTILWPVMFVGACWTSFALITYFVGVLPAIIILMGVGAALRYKTQWRETFSDGVPIVFVSVSLAAFGLSLEPLGLVIALLFLMCLGAFAARDLRPLETLIAALVLIALSWAIFILGLGLVIPVWPEW